MAEDTVEEIDRFFDHNVAAVDAIASTALAEGMLSAELVVLVMDASKGKGRQLAEMLAKREGVTVDEYFADVPAGTDPTLVRPMRRQDASAMIAHWNGKVAEVLDDPPSEDGFWVVVMAAGSTRIIDRPVPSLRMN